MFFDSAKAISLLLTQETDDRTQIKARAFQYTFSCINKLRILFFVIKKNTND